MDGKDRDGGGGDRSWPPGMGRHCSLAKAGKGLLGAGYRQAPGTQGQGPDGGRKESQRPGSPVFQSQGGVLPLELTPP
jgi:hypothetical protein